MSNAALLDDDLARLDALLGFDWNTVAAWVAERPAIERVLSAVYFGLHSQTVILLLFGSLTRPGERNGEALWLFIVAGVLTVAVFAFTPALGKIGHLGTYQVEMLAQIRAGQWTVLDYGKLLGIVNFPSFHTALAILWTYAVRRHRWALAVSTPLNAILIAATPAIGGHYLVDLLAGAAVAIVSIAFVKAMQRRAAADGATAGPVLVTSRASVTAVDARRGTSPRRRPTPVVVLRRYKRSTARRSASVRGSAATWASVTGRTGVLRRR